MAAASLWQTEYKRVECAGMRIVYVDRRFDTPAVFRYHRAAWVPVGDRSSARERRVRKGDCGGDVVSEGLLHATRTSAQLPRGTAVAGENDAVGCQQTPVA